MKRIVFTIALGLFVIFNLSAQRDKAQDSLSENSKSVAQTVDESFSKLMKESNNFKSYKVVKLNAIQGLQSNTKRQIEELESTITHLNSEINDLQAQVDESKKELDQTNTALKEAEISKDQFSFLGIKTMKNTYQVIVIVIIVILLVLLIAFIGKFRAGNKSTVKAQKDLRDLQRDYDEYRQKALETQQKLGRQLQDERNRNAAK